MHQLAQKRQAIHARHFDIQRHHIGTERENFFARAIRINGGADDFDVPERGQTVRDDFSRERGIIHHQ